MSFARWESCQFSFHYFSWGPNPHNHNKLYFYRRVQTKAAFQGIRLNFTWPPVFLGNTVLLELLVSSLMLLHNETLNNKPAVPLYTVVPKLRGIIQIVCLCAGSSYCAVNEQSVCVRFSSGTPSEFAKRYMSKDFLSDYKQNLVGIFYQVMPDNIVRHSMQQ